MMYKTLKNKVDKLAAAYEYAEENLRYDGNLINNFTSIVYSDIDKELDYKFIKDIRKHISSKTPWFSSFRGNSLYMLSILLSVEEDWNNVFEKVAFWEEHLRSAGFREGTYLVMSSWVLAKSIGDEEDKEDVLRRVIGFYNFIKKNYSNITSSDDYLVCVFLAIANLSPLEYKSTLDYILKNLKKGQEYTSNNRAQALANALTMDRKECESNLDRVRAIIYGCEKIGYQIPNHYMTVIGIATLFIKDTNELLSEVEVAIEYLSQFHQYNFFMDKSFKCILAIITVLNDRKINKVILNSIIAVCINDEIEGQTNSLLSSVN
ncbi:DUF4003 domain-containing protein [Inconstantimicrobium mannanitabidum]|nr:DUF4003 domain-containing protein [Clostridium sp. TW13]